MKILCHLGCGLVALITGSLPGLVSSAESVPSGYRVVASESAIPDAIFYAVALAESGRVLKTDGVLRPWPWTLNVAGDGYYYPTRIEAWQPKPYQLLNKPRYEMQEIKHRSKYRAKAA